MVVLDEKEVQKIVQDELALHKKRDSYISASDDTLLRSERMVGLAERQLHKYELQIKSIYQPMENWVTSTKAVILGLAGTREATEDNTRMIPRYIVGIANLVLARRRHIKWMGQEQEFYDRNKGDMSKMMRAYQATKLTVMKLGSAFISMTMILASLAVVFGIASLALQGTDSALFQFYESLDPMDQMLAILGGMAVIIYAVGGAFGLIAAAVAGFAAVLSGQLSPKMSIFTAIVSGLALILAGVVLGIMSWPLFFGIAIFTALTLVYRFRKTIIAVFKSAGQAIWDATIGNFIRGYKWLIKVWKKFKANPLKTAWSYSPLGLAMSAGNRLGGALTDNSTTNIYVTGSGVRGSDEELASNISRSLSIEKRRRGGSTTQGALP